MDNNKHTPGPWTVARGADGGPLVSTGKKFGGYEEIVANVYRPSTHVRMAGMTDASDANARTIAAAPEMLATLNLILSRSQIGKPVSLTLEEINALSRLIARAEGRVS
jgi:hypothetical protein